jgi:hypothetical protein
MTVCGPAIQLCKTREYVCQWVFLIFQTLKELQLVVNELQEGFFVGFGNRYYLIGNFDPAALYRFYLIYGNHVRLVYTAYKMRRYQLFKFVKTLQGHDLFI